MFFNGLQFLILSIGLPLSADGLKTRLVGSTDSSCSGRVEVFHDDSWGTVCDDKWNMKNAEVVCRSINCGVALDVKQRAFFGEGKDRIWLDDVTCTGRESHLEECEHKDFGMNNCGHSEDVGVICSDHIKLANGTKQCSGRVEVKHNGHWRKVCRSEWSQKEQEVLCNELKCGSPVSVHDTPYFGHDSTTPAVNFNCLGNETSLMQCHLKEGNERCDDATILCTYSKPIRLANGTHPCAGRVEVFHEGQWGTACDDSWGMQEAEVVCREMKCGTALEVKYQAFFGAGDGQILMDDTHCKGQEMSLIDCQHGGFEMNDCSHAEDAGVICSEKVKLVNGTDRCSGRLEVNHGGHWGKICSSNWNTQLETRLCKELECGIPGKNPRPNFGESHGLKSYRPSCVGTEGSIADCSIQVTNATCEDVAVSCSGPSELKLVNGTNRCSGRVMILHDGQWGTICDDQWDIQDAQVVCRVMECGSALYAKTAAAYGQGAGRIWLDDVQCFGNETSLTECHNTGFGENNCGHSEDAGVECSTNTRLLDGHNHCSGRVEIFHGGHWSPVYNNQWGKNEASVVCREMKCGDAADDPLVSPRYGQASGPRGYTASCSGSESNITLCTLREFVPTDLSQSQPATVVCSGNVRLVNGSHKCSGRVEIYDNGQWGTVCDASWDMNDAMVICKQLGCGRAQRITKNGYFGQGSGRIVVGQTACRGQETSIDQCHLKPSDNTCMPTSVAGVFCSDGLPVRLVHDTGNCFGRVEVQHAGQWATVCNKDWTLHHSTVVCELLDCGSPVAITSEAQFAQGTGPIWEASNSCFNNEESLFKCSLNGFNSTSCGHEQDAKVVCAEQIRLANGRSECSGRVEIYHEGQWGTVCDDEWELNNADVVCRQLGCGQAISFVGSSEFGSGSGPIWLDNLICTGQENAITECAHHNFGENNCGHSEDAGVLCLGILPKPQITINPAPQVNFGERVEITCSMITEHFGGTFILQQTPGSFKLERYSDSDATTFTLPKVDFSHSGWYHCGYQKRLATKSIAFPPGDSAELKVTVDLQKPTISLVSPGAVLIFTPDNIEVKAGSGLSLFCSIYSKYADGLFTLSKSNTTYIKPKPALSHSIFQMAFFEFPAVKATDQGSYNCIYSVNISKHLYCSHPSNPLYVIVTESSVAATVTGALVCLLLLLALIFAAYLFWRRRGQASRAMIQFSSRVGDVLKQDGEEKVEVTPGGRDYNTLANENGNGRGPENKAADVDSEERNTTEDLTGRVCYELEPLIHS